jgi:hypothetical protein
VLGLLVAIIGVAIGCRSAPSAGSSSPPDAVVTAQPTQPADTGTPRSSPVAVEVRSQPAEAQELIGKTCRVSFRRDALGLAAASTPEPTAPAIAGHQVQLTGVVERFGDGWLVLHIDGKRYWIATSAILLIELQE